MAHYDYHCPACGLTFDVEHPMGEHPSVSCPECGLAAEHVFSASGIVFKGSGYYNTDQRGSSKQTAATTAPAASKSESPCANCPNKAAS